MKNLGVQIVPGMFHLEGGDMVMQALAEKLWALDLMQALAEKLWKKTKLRCTDGWSEKLPTQKQSNGLAAAKEMFWTQKMSGKKGKGEGCHKHCGVKCSLHMPEICFT
jgi:hypothetical protein